MAIDVTKCENYKFLTDDGTKPIRCDNGRTCIPPDVAAEQANAICTLLVGKGFSFNQIYTLLLIVEDAFREARDEQSWRIKL